MDLIITPAKLCGTFRAVPSEEEALRFLVCGALSKPSSVIKGVGMTENVSRLINALKIMGAQLSVRDDCIRFADMVIKKSISVDCGSSFPALAYALPIAAAYGVNAKFCGSQSLADDKLEKFIACLCSHGITTDYCGKMPFKISGSLGSGIYELPPDSPHQLISGLMLALAIFETDSMIVFSSQPKHKPYIDMTLNAMHHSRIQAVCSSDKYVIRGGQNFCLSEARAGGDFLIASNFAAANAMTSNLSVTGLDAASFQPETAVFEIIRSVMYSGRKGFDYDFSGCLSLAPIMAVFACSLKGESVLRNIGEEAIGNISAMINGAGGCAYSDGGNLRIKGRKSLAGGSLDSCGSPEIVYAAMILSTICRGNLTVNNAECAKEYCPEFFEAFHDLGGIMEYSTGQPPILKN